MVVVVVVVLASMRGCMRACCLAAACRCCLLSPNRHDEFPLGLSVLHIYFPEFLLLRSFICNTNEHALIHNNNDEATEAQTLTHTHARTNTI